MTERELLEYVREELDIRERLSVVNKPLSVVVDLNGSDKFGVIYSKLEKNSNLEELEESTLVTETNSSVIFVDSRYQEIIITLKADYDGDNYQLVVTYNK